MEAWYTSLKASGKLPTGVKPTVTGYSLGGHLATAFNQLHPNDAAATYTFNGAGIGDLTSGKSLATVIADFDRMRKNADRQQIVFSNADAQALYESWRQIPSIAWSPLNFALETAKLAPIPRARLLGRMLRSTGKNGQNRNLASLWQTNQVANGIKGRATA